jgi:Flp pilus assembly protein TadG
MNASSRRPPIGKSLRERRCAPAGAERRRGTAVVEAVFIMPIMLSLMLGVWEVGRMIQVRQILENAAREGARVAAGGYVNGTAVTVSTVQTEVQNYLTAAGLPSTAVTGTQTSLTCLASPVWTDPYQAQPLDPFTVTLTISTRFHCCCCTSRCSSAYSCC